MYMYINIYPRKMFTDEMIMNEKYTWNGIFRIDYSMNPLMTVAADFFLCLINCCRHVHSRLPYIANEFHVFKCNNKHKINLD